MSAKQTAAVSLMAAGALSLAYGGFNYIQETHEANGGPVRLAVDQERHINVPGWAGAAMLVWGAVLMIPGKKS